MQMARTEGVEQLDRIESRELDFLLRRMANDIARVSAEDLLWESARFALICYSAHKERETDWVDFADKLDAALSSKGPAHIPDSVMRPGLRSLALVRS